MRGFRCFLFGFAVLGQTLNALPQNEKVVQGEVSFATDDNSSLTIQASNRAIIEFEGFSIGADQQVRFIQPDSKSSVLNRIVGTDPSKILGSLHANGKVILVNPNGVYFSKDSVVQLGSLIATSYDLSNKSFLSDSYHFTPTSEASIVNEGSLGADHVIALIAKKVTNTGVISSEDAIITAKGITLCFEEDQMVQFLIDEQDLPGIIENHGKIDAQREVLLSANQAKSIIDSVLNTEGVNDATVLVNDGGVIRLTSGSSIYAKSVQIEAEKLDISGSSIYSTAEQISLRATRSLSLTETKNHPLVLASHKELLLFGEKELTILAYQHPESVIASGSDLRIISDYPTQTDAQFFSGGSFSIEDSMGSSSSFYALFDPIISANESVFFGTYTGVSLKVESKGEILAEGTINITGPDGSLVGTDPDIPILRDTASLILRSGLSALEHTNNIPKNVGGADFVASGSTKTGITIKEVITISGGPIIFQAAGSDEIRVEKNIVISPQTNDASIAMSGPNITLMGTSYSAKVQSYSADKLSIDSSALCSFNSLGGAIAYSCNEMFLGAGTDLSVVSSGSAIVMAPLVSSQKQSVTINAGNGQCTLKAMGSLQTPISDLSITAANLLIRGDLYSKTLTMTHMNPINTLYLGGSIYVSNQPLSFTNPILRDNQDDVILSSPQGISFGAQSTINTDVTTRNLTLVASSPANILCGGAVGSASALNDLTIHTVANTTFQQDVHVNKLTASDSRGILCFDAPVFVGAGGLDLTVDQIQFHDNLTTTNGGAVLLSTKAELRFCCGSVLSLSGSFTQTGTGGVSLGTDLITQDAPISFASPINLTADVTVSSGAGVGDITFLNSVNGAYNFTLDSGAGDIHCDTNIGNAIPVKVFTLNSLHNGLFGLINAESIVQLAGTGKSKFHGAVTTTGAAGINMVGSGLYFGCWVKTFAGGPMHLTNSGEVNLGCYDHSFSVDLSGEFTQNGTGSVVLGAYMLCKKSVSFSGDISLSYSSIIDTSASNSNIHFQGKIDGNHGLTLTTGSGDIHFDQPIGSVNAIGKLSIVQARDVNIYSIRAATLNQLGGSGTMTLSNSSELFNSSGIHLIGNHMVLTGQVTTNKAGPLVVENAGTCTIGPGGINLSGPLKQIGAGPLQLCCTINTNDRAIVFNSSVLLMQDSTIHTGANLGGIEFYGAIQGPANLTLEAGSGDVIFAKSVGGVQKLESLQVTGAKNIIFKGASYAADHQSYASINQFQMEAQPSVSFVSTTADSLVFNTGTISLGNNTDFNLITANGDITICDLVGTSLENITINAGSAMVTLGSLGAPRKDSSFVNTIPSHLLNRETSLKSPLEEPPFQQINSVQITAGDIKVHGNLYAKALVFHHDLPTNILYLGGDINLDNDSITFNNPIVRDFVYDAKINTGGQSITFGPNATVNGDGQPRNLDLYTFGAPITVNSVVGGIARLEGLLTIPNTSDVTFQALSAGGLILKKVTGAATFAGALDFNQDEGLQFKGKDCFIQQPITTTQGGKCSITHDGQFILSSGAALNLSGAFIQDGTGSVTINSDIITASSDIIFLSDVNLGTSLLLNTGVGAGDVQFSKGIEGTVSLSVSAGTGDVSFTKNFGVNAPLVNMNISSSSKVTFYGSNYRANTQTYTGSNFYLSGARPIRFSSTNSAITFSPGPIHLNTGTNLSIDTGNGALTLGAIRGDSVQSVMLTSGSGTTQVGAIGASGFSEIGVVSISCGDLKVRGDVYAKTLSINHDLGTRTLYLGGGIHTQNQALVFSNPILRDYVNQGVSISTNGAPITMQTAATIDADIAGRNLQFDTGGADVTIHSEIGSTTALGVITLTNIKDGYFNTIEAKGLVQNSGTGLTTLAGAVITDGVTGLYLEGNAFALNGDITTSAAGPLHIRNGGMLSLSPSALFTLDGAFIQDGIGPVSLCASIVTNDANIDISSPISLTQNFMLNTGTGSVGNILLHNGVSGPFDLTLIADQGNVTFDQPLGASGAIGHVTITSAKNVTTSSITAKSLTQSAGSGTTYLQGILHTTTATGVQLTGTNFTLENITTDAGGGLTVTNAALLNMIGGSNVTLGGGFLQNGLGAVHLASFISTNNSEIRFTKAVTLTDSAGLNSGVGAGDIVFLSTLDGEKNITLSSGTGDITLSGAVGSMQPLNDVVIESADQITVASTFSSKGLNASFTQLADFTGALSAKSTGITLTGGAILIQAPLTTTLGGNVSITNSGQLTFASGANAVLDGSFVQAGSGTVALAANVTTNNSALTFSSPLIFTAPVTCQSGTGAGNIFFGSSVDGLQSFAVDAGIGNITFSGAIGSTSAPSSVTIARAKDVQMQAVTAGSLVQSGGSGKTTIFGVSSATAAGGIDLTGLDFLIKNPMQTTLGGIRVNNSGTFTVESGAVITAATSFDQAGLGQFILGADITATNALLETNGAVLLTAPVTLSSTGGNIVLNNRFDGSFDLTLVAGGGNITAAEPIGQEARLATFSLQSGANMTFNTIVAQDINHISGTGLTTFLGTLDTSSVSGITLTGNAFTLNGIIITDNSGPFVVNNSGLLLVESMITTLLDGSFSQTGSGLVSLAGNITTTADPISFNSSVAVTDDSIISTGAGIGDITFLAPLEGTKSLTLSSGTGNIHFQEVGSTSALTDLKVKNANIVYFHKDIGDIPSRGINQNLEITADKLIFESNTYHANKQIYVVQTQYQINAALGATTILSDSGSITFAGAPIQMAPSSSLIIQATGGGLSLGSVFGNSAHALVLRSTNSSVTLGGIGSGADEFSSVILQGEGISFSDDIYADTISFVGSPTNLLSMGGDIRTKGTNIEIDFPVVRHAKQSVTLSTSTGLGDVIFGGPIDGYDATQNWDLIVDAGSGNVVFDGTVGGQKRLNLLSVKGGMVDVNQQLKVKSDVILDGNIYLCSHIDTQAGDITFQGNVVRDGINNVIVSTSKLDGFVHFTGLLNADNPTNLRNLEINALSGDITLSGTVGGVVPLDRLVISAKTVQISDVGTGVAGGDHDTIISATDTLTLTGSNYNANMQSYSSTNKMRLTAGATVNFVSSNDPVSFITPTLELSSATNVDIQTSGGIVTLPKIKSLGTSTVSVAAGTGRVYFGGAGTAGATEFSQVALAGGDLEIQGDLYSDEVQLTPGASSSVLLYAGIYTTNTDINIPRPAVCYGTNVILSTGAGGGNITLGNILIADSLVTTRNVVMQAGEGNIVISGATGALAPLNNLDITAANITVADIGGASAGIKGIANLTVPPDGNINLTGTIYKGDIRFHYDGN